MRAAILAAVAAVGLSVILASAVLAQNDPFADIENAWEQVMDEEEVGFDRAAAAMDKAWLAAEKEQNEKWERLKKRIEGKWGDSKMSTKTEWVDYTDDLGARTEVDFEEGVIVIEALVPADEPEPEKVGQEMVAAKFEETFLKKDEKTQQSHLADQIRTETGEPVTEENLQQYVQAEVVAEIEIIPETIVGEDGKEKKKVRVEIVLVPDHLRKRAERYKEEVMQSSKRYHMEPALILAVIHSESSFNPMAASGAGACGLMQIIPRFAGREAYVYLYKKDKVMDEAYLFDPENNVRLGSTYLFLLATHYLKDIPDPEKRVALAICSYNWGPTAVRKKIINKHPVQTMSDEELVALLKKKAPKETGNYLDRVQNRKKLYGALEWE